jgi:hypothetical protein
LDSIITKKTYKAIYRLLDHVSPIDGDCGKLCGSACCTCGDDEAAGQGFTLGIYLLPGEDQMFTKKEDWLEWSYSKAEDLDFPESWFGDVYFIRCLTPPDCRRELRPIQCRTYPLTPHLSVNGMLRMILFPMDELPYSCPLIDEDIKLSKRFVRATFSAWFHLLRDPLIYDLIAYDSALRNESKLKFITVPTGNPDDF